jgi:hypothetical protein
MQERVFMRAMFTERMRSWRNSKQSEKKEGDDNWAVGVGRNVI